MPKKNPKHNPARLERMERRRGSAQIVKSGSAGVIKKIANAPRSPRESLTISSPFHFDPAAEERRQEYIALLGKRNVLYAKGRKLVCLDCELDFFFGKRERGQPHGDHAGYTHASYYEKFLYLFVQVNMGVNRYLPDIKDIFTGEKIQQFLTEILPAILGDSPASPPEVETIRAEFVDLIAYFEERGQLTADQAADVWEHVGSEETVRERFAKSCQQAQVLSFDPAWFDESVPVPPDEYQRRLQVETHNPTLSPLSSFEYELAEGIRTYVTVNGRNNGLDSVHHKDRILEICVLFARYTYLLAKQAAAAGFPPYKIEHVWPGALQVWGGTDFFAKNSVHLFPQDTIECIWDTCRRFLKNNCKNCNYHCLRVYVPPAVTRARQEVIYTRQTG